MTLAVYAQDPRYRGGVLTMLEAFWRAARDLGEEPELRYVEQPSFAGQTAPAPFDVPGVMAGPRHVDALRQLRGAKAIPPGPNEKLWVVSGLAPAGLPAARSGRPYGCWLATGMEREWAGRRGGLPASRRAAMALSAPSLRRYEREVVANATVVDALSPSAARDLADVGGREVGVLPFPIDLERFSPAPDDEWLAGLDEPLLVFVGRGSDPRKNVGLLLEALPLIRREVPVRLRLVGEPPAHLPEGVEAVGETREVERHLRDAHLFVLPSLQEGFGIVLAEALAAGVPALSTPSGGPDELLPASGGGRLLEGFDAEELATTAVAMLRDREQLLAMRRAGREYVAREHSSDRFRARVADVTARL